MKRFILFFSVFFFVLSANHIKAQDIDTLFLSQIIECPGDEATLDVYLNQISPPATYNIVLQMMSPSGGFNDEDSEDNTTIDNHQFTNLSSGLYRVLLVDPSLTTNPSGMDPGGFCITDPLIYDCQTIFVAAPNPLLIVAADDTLDCWDDTIAALTISLTGFTNPYTVELETGGVTINPPGTVTLPSNVTTYTWNNLSAGNYNIIVQDTFGCSQSQPYTIEAPDPISPNAQVDDSITCYRAANGVISVNPTGGTPGYSYLWNNGDTTATIGPLQAGSYWCTITDILGCDTTTLPITLLNPPALSATTTITSVINCKDSCNGEVTVTVDPANTGAGGPYTFSLENVATGITIDTISHPGTSFTFTNICAGDYRSRVIDITPCDSISDVINIVEPDYITFTITDTSYNGWNISCNGACDGQITISNFIGGNGAPYLYNGDTISITGDSTFSNLCRNAGIPYSYTIIDSLGCQGTQSIVLTEPDIFSIDSLSTTDPSCPTICDGAVIVVSSNGVDSVNYWITNSFISTNIENDTVTINGVCGFNTNGEDTIVAIDLNGCIDTLFTSLAEADTFIWSMGAEMENCALGNGQAWVNITQGGTPFSSGDYTHNWSGPFGNDSVAPSTLFPNSDTITGLQYGWYVDSIADSLGCYFIDSILVDSGAILIDVLVAVPCNDSTNGVITLTNSVELTSIVWTNETDSTEDLTTPGIYHPTILQNDSNFYSSILDSVSSQEYYCEIQLTGCDPYRDTIIVGPGVTMDATNYTVFTEDTLSCFGDQTDSIWIDVTNTFGLGPQSFYALGSSLWFAGAQAPPFNILHSGLGIPPNAVDANLYEIIITPFAPQHSNCVDTVNILIWQPDSLEFVLGTDSVLCNGDASGIVYIDTIFGGTPFSSGDYSYIWTDTNGVVISTNDSLINVVAGDYILSVIDSNGCDTTSGQVTLYEPDPISFTASIDSISLCTYLNYTGQITVTPSGGQGPGTYSYSWTASIDSLGFPTSFIDSTEIIDFLASGWYVLELTDTNYNGSNSCIYTDSVFMPNGNGPIIDAGITNVSCYGYSDASYHATISGVDPPFAFWDSVSASFLDTSIYTPTDNGLSPAVYGDSILVLTAQDGRGCINTDTFYITQPDSLIIRNVTTSEYPGGTNISCWEYLDGSVDIDSVTGGTMPYYYYVNTLSNQDSTNHFFDTLAAAWYYCDVIDANGCTYRDSVTLTHPDSLYIDTMIASAYVGGWGVSCYGFNDGSAYVHATGGTYDGTTYTYTYNWSNNDSGDSISMLLGNTWYTVNVTDTNGCHTLDSIFVSEPTPLVIDSLTSIDVLCNAESSDWVQDDRGEATIFVSGATPNYYYLWDNEDLTSPAYASPNDTVGSNNDTTATADTLRAGWYTVQVWDENGCYVTASVEIFEPSISVEIDDTLVNQMTCTSWNNASVTIIATGPQPLPYWYYVYEDALNPIDTASQGNLGYNDGMYPGSWVAMVEDTLGCWDRDTIRINNLDSVRIDSITTIDVSCNGYNDGYVQNITASGGYSPYTYSINGGPQHSSWLCDSLNPGCPTGYVFANLTPGWHTIEITDSTGECKSSELIEITEPPALQVAISQNWYSSSYNILCPGGADSAFITIGGGIPPYSITHNNVTHITMSNDVFAGVPAGPQTFVIVDNSGDGCVDTNTVVFNEPSVIQLDSVIINDILCDGWTNGSITAMVSGGVGQGNGALYTYQWYNGTGTSSPIPGATSYTINNLVVGNYTLKVTDNHDCSATFTWSIGSDTLTIDNLAINAGGITDVTCFEDCDGEIDLDAVNNVTGGTPFSTGTYQFLWDDALSQTTDVATGLCEGTYTVTITDQEGCVTSASFTVSQPDLLTVDFPNDPLANISCFGEDDGALDLIINGGNGPGATGCTYLWSNNTTGATATGLSEGTYSVLVTDSEGCEATAEYTLDAPTVVDIPVSAIDPTDVDCKGNSTGEIKVTAEGGTPIPGIPGMYDYYLEDGQGNAIDNCTNCVDAIFTNLPAGIYTVTVFDDEGCEYTTSNILVNEPTEELSLVIEAENGTCLTPSPSLTAYASGGTAGYEFSIDGGSFQSGNGDHYTFSSLNAQGYTTYSITVQDNNECTATATESVINYLYSFFPDNLNDYEVTICLGEEINIDVTECDGCTYYWTMTNGDTIANTASLSITTDLSWSPFEILTLTITDEYGCSISLDAEITLDQLNAACSATSNAIMKGESVTLTSSSSFSTYEWTNTSGEVLSNNNEVIIIPEKSDTFYVYATDGMCIAYCWVHVAVGLDPYNAISPNGDGYNDTWVVKFIDRFDATVQIFNRWGTLIFEGDCDGDVCWDGSVDGKDAPTGTYYYTIDYNDGSELVKGTITLVR